MTAPWQATAREADAKLLLDSITRHLPGAIYVYQRWPDGRAQLLYVNDGIQGIYGVSAEQVRENPQLVEDSVHPEDRAAFARRIEDSFTAANTWNHGFRIRRADGTVRHVDAIADPAPQADGSIIWYGHLRDITALKAAEQARFDVVQRYRDAIEQIGDGAWFYDASTDVFSFSACWRARICGDALKEIHDQASWIDRVHPAHRELVFEATRSLLQGETSVLSLEYRLRDSSGAYFWVHARGAVTERTASGVPWVLSGTIADIAARKDAERQLRLQARVIESAPVGVFVADLDGTNLPIVHLNPTCKAIFEIHCDGEAPPALGVADLVSSPTELAATLQSLYAQSSSQRVGEYVAPSGLRKQLRITATADLDADQPQLFGIVEDVTADIALRDDLIRAREVAEQANAAKSRFIAHVSHELRTPLHGIMGLSELVAADSALPAQARQQAGEVHRAARHLLTLIGDIIDMSAMEAGRLALSIEPVPVARIVEQVMRLALPVADEHGVALLADERLRAARRVHADSTRATQVLLNLVSNGIKYNHAGGFVALRLLEAPAGMLRIGVEDNGGGITTEALDKLFEQFNRLGRELSAIEGSGIGLTIARSLAEAMGGTLGVSSRAGAGSTFWLDLPAAPDDLEASLDAAPPRPPCPLASSALRVLVAEDNALSQEVFRRQLDKLGCAATLVGDGAAAWDCWQRGDYDVLLTDVHMPGLDGLELARRIRAAEAAGRAQRTFIVGVSANAMKEAERSALLHGMDGYLTKPVTLEALEDVLRACPGAAPTPGATAVTPREPATDDALDLTELARYVGEEPDVLASFVEQLGESLAQDAAALTAALHAGALARAQEIAHRLKSTGRTAGARSLVDLCAAIEHASADHHRDTCREHAHALTACMARIEHALAAQRAVLASGRPAQSASLVSN